MEQPWTVSRRQLFGLGAAASVWVVAGCTNSDTTASTATAPSPDPTLAAALARETKLLQRAATLQLRSVAAVLTEHVSALRLAVDPSLPLPSGISTSPSDRPGNAAAPAPAAVAKLAAQLRVAADRTQRDVPNARVGQAAALLAAVAASDAALAAWVGDNSLRPTAPTLAWAGAYAVPTTTADEFEKSAASGVATDLNTWQNALGVEHAAVYAFGLIGGQLGPKDLRAQWSLASHQARRDALTAALVAASATPTPAAAAYESVRPVTTATAAGRLAASVERASQAANASLVTAGDSWWRLVATEWQRASTLAFLGWTGVVVPLPGLQPD